MIAYKTCLPPMAPWSISLQTWPAGPSLKVLKTYGPEEVEQQKAREMSDVELAKRVASVQTKSGRRLATTKYYHRDQYVAEYARRRAAGRCGLCRKWAPFRDKNGKPFLETHHLVWLSRGGEDSTSNVAALCPNCHRHMHILDDEESRLHVEERIARG